MSKKILSLLFVLCLLLGAVSTVYAEGERTWKDPETGYEALVEDDADLLSVSEEEKLLKEMQSFTAYGNAFFKSVSSNGLSADDYARAVYHERFGNGSSGALFLIDMDNRKIAVFTDGAVYSVVDVDHAAIVVDNCYSYASDAEYYRCASTAFEQIGRLMRNEEIAQPMKYISNALLALALALFSNFFLVKATCTVDPATPERHIRLAVRSFRADKHMTVKKSGSSKRYVESSGGSDSGGSSGGGSSGGGGGGSSGGGASHSF